MKKQCLMKKLAMFSFLLLIIISCKKKEELVKPNLENPAITQNDSTFSNADRELLAKIAQKGFNIENAKLLRDSVFIVEGDIEFPKSQLENQKQFSIAQESVGTFVSDQYVSNIRVFIEPGVPDFWKAAIRTSISNWDNNIPANKVHFTEVSAAPYDIRVFLDYAANGGWIASAALPYNGKPGVHVRINTFYNNIPTSQKILSMMHEMGHTIGLAHTDIADHHIDGTAYGDPSSIMVSQMPAYQPSTNFSHYDIRAVQILYPQPGRNSRLQPIYRYYRTFPIDGHFYTNNFTELRFNSYEGTECYVWDNQVLGSVAIYRYYNSQANKHMYTTNWDELGAGDYGYVFERIIGYAYNSQVSGTVPVYRYVKPTTGNHFFSRNSSTPTGYISEGIGWYAFL